MPPRNWLFRIKDILDSVSAVKTYVAGMTSEDFTADRKTVDAVVRNLIIIGEATAHIPEEICRSHQEIPWTDMRAMRNFVVHEYFGVSDKILWDTVQTDLPPLIPLLKGIVEIYSNRNDKTL
ncbi:MAG TPA: DUF86 domain-containing protein [Nitrospirae bacterium]|nr:DUF86 domain-containing protein [Nitrospirota bacterium]